MLFNLLLPLLVLGGLTVVIAGTFASLLVFRSMETRPMVINGLAGTVLSYLLVWLTPLGAGVTIRLNAVAVYPVWAAALALVVAVLWRVALGVAPAPPTREEQEAQRARRARERAARYRSSD